MYVAWEHMPALGLPEVHTTTDDKYTGPGVLVVYSTRVFDIHWYSMIYRFQCPGINPRGAGYFLETNIYIYTIYIISRNWHGADE